MQVRPNPAWTNHALFRQWDDLEYLVGHANMPKITSKTAHKLKAKEYGSGAYGTVMPSNTKGIVVKVTSDPTEATFAYVVQKLRKYPEGMVKYYEVFRLDGTHSERPIYIIWREEAYNVGKSLTPQAEEMLLALRDHADPAFQLTSWPDLKEENLGPIVSAAKTYRKHTGYEHGGTGPGFVDAIKLLFSGDLTKAGYGVAAARAIADDIAHGDSGRLVGAAIRDLIDQDILLADIHPGNVGKVPRRGQKRTVITDPGNVATLTDRYDRYLVPTVDEALGKSVSKRRASRGR